jgi:uncharacterized protein (TIGR00369 family)
MQIEASAEDLFARFPMPPCASLLGWRLLDSNARRGWARLSFEGRSAFLNPAGFIQGGILSAMLDDAMGSTVFVASEGMLFTATIDMNVSFVAPARPGRLFAEGQVVRLRKSIAFLEAQLFDRDGELLARATSTARLVPVEKLAN